MLFGCALWGWTAPAQAAELELQLRFTAGSPGAQSGGEVVVGIDAAATSGFDPGQDSRAFRLGPLQAWSLQPVTTPERVRYLGRDWRSGAGEEIWQIQVATPATPIGDQVVQDSVISVEWNPPAAADGTCVSRDLQLIDPVGNVFLMTDVFGLDFPAPGAGATYDFTLIAGVPKVSGGIAPDAPSRLAIPYIGRRGNMLVWASGKGNKARYHVERASDPAGLFERITPEPVKASRWLDDSPEAKQSGTYFYRVVAVSGSGCASVPSDIIEVTR
ncbi:MAG: hypothetical protein ACE5FN_02750 [Leptospirillia bacterium]